MVLRDAERRNRSARLAARGAARLRARHLGGTHARERGRLPVPSHARAGRRDPVPPRLRGGKPALLRSAASATGESRRGVVFVKELVPRRAIAASRATVVRRELRGAADASRVGVGRGPRSRARTSGATAAGWQGNRRALLRRARVPGEIPSRRSSPSTTGAITARRTGRGRWSTRSSIRAGRCGGRAEPTCACDVAGATGRSSSKRSRAAPHRVRRRGIRDRGPARCRMLACEVDPETLAGAEEFWAQRLGCPVAALQRRGLTLLVHPRRRCSSSRPRAGTVVTAPPELHRSDRRRGGPPSTHGLGRRCARSSRRPRARSARRGSAIRVSPRARPATRSPSTPRTIRRSRSCAPR